MAIFTGLSDIILFFILFLLIYCFNDSIVALIILAVFSAYSADIYVRTVMDGTNPDSVKFVFFFASLTIFAMGNIYMWIHDYTEKKKAESIGV